MKVAVPTNFPGGLDAQRSDHFGHCDIFTVIELDAQKEVVQVSTVVNGDHSAGGCVVPVQVLQETGVDAIVVGGMGARPMQGFAQAGIAVYFAGHTMFTTAKEVLDGFLDGQLPVMHANQVCQGSGNCHH